MKNLLLTPRGQTELNFWIAEDPKMALKILGLIKDIQRDPFRGFRKAGADAIQISGFVV